MNLTSIKSYLPWCTASFVDMAAEGIRKLALDDFERGVTNAKELPGSHDIPPSWGTFFFYVGSSVNFKTIGQKSETYSPTPKT